jgi:hypothetical protein
MKNLFLGTTLIHCFSLCFHETAFSQKNNKDLTGAWLEYKLRTDEPRKLFAWVVVKNVPEQSDTLLFFKTAYEERIIVYKPKKVVIERANEKGNYIVEGNEIVLTNRIAKSIPDSLTKKAPLKDLRMKYELKGRRLIVYEKIKEKRGEEFVDVNYKLKRYFRRVKKN